MMSMKVALGLLLVAGLCAVTHAMSIFPEEFSARLTVKHGPQEYAAALYVKNDNKDHILWVKVQSGDKEGAVRTVYKSDTAGSFNLIKAGVDPKGQLDLERADCDNLPLGSIIDLGGMSFIPRPVEEAVPKYKKLCKDCDSTFVFEVRNRFFILLAAGSSPKFVVGADDFIATVVSFAPGKSDDFKEDVAKSCAVLVSKVKSMDKDKTHMPADQAKLFTKKKTLGKPLHKFDGYADAVVAYMFGDALKIKMGEEELPVKKDPKPDRPSPGGRRPEAELVPPVRFAEARVGRCTRSNIGDGKCDPDCNTARYNYDAGDCCEGSCKLYEYYVSVLDITHPVHQYRQHICGAQGYSCSAPPKATCGFFHGFMNAFGQAAGSPNAFGPGENPINGHYWANMANEMEGICNTVAYNNHETVNTGWNNTQLQLDYYTYTRQIHLAAARSRLRPAVFAHSMANMLLTGACLDQGHCDVKWYDLSGPIRGSRAAENAIGVTAIAGLRGLASAINWIRPGTISGVLKAQDTLAPSFRDLATDTAHPDRLSSVAGGSVAGLRGPPSPLLHGAACGYKGISSWTSPVAYVMATVKTVVYGYNALSDGVVGMDECELYRDFATGNPFLTQFGAFQQDDPLSPWYHFPGNHQSATGGLGEGDAARVLTYMRAQADGFPQLYIMYLRTRRLI